MMQKMSKTPGELSFDYQFINEKHAISNRFASDVPKILSIEATFKIILNGNVYFEEEIAILEFYKTLSNWKETVTPMSIPEFHYYTLEHAYEEEPIISMIPFSNKGRIQSIWPKADVYNVFELDFLVTSLMSLETDLRNGIEDYYEISLKKFMKHIPFREKIDER